MCKQNKMLNKINLIMKLLIVERWNKSIPFCTVWDPETLLPWQRDVKTSPLYCSFVLSSMSRDPKNWPIGRLRFSFKQTWICTTWPGFSLNCRQLLFTSTKKKVVSRQFYTYNCSGQFLSAYFYSEKDWTWIWRLPFGANVNRHLSNRWPVRPQ